VRVSHEIEANSKMPMFCTLINALPRPNNLHRSPHWRHATTYAAATGNASLMAHLELSIPIPSTHSATLAGYSPPPGTRGKKLEKKPNRQHNLGRSRIINHTLFRQTELSSVDWVFCGGISLYLDLSLRLGMSVYIYLNLF
jgi:hypothetical protein